MEERDFYAEIRVIAGEWLETGASAGVIAEELSDMCENLEQV